MASLDGMSKLHLKGAQQGRCSETTGLPFLHVVFVLLIDHCGQHLGTQRVVSGESTSVAQTEPSQQSALLVQPVAFCGRQTPHLLSALQDRPRQHSDAAEQLFPLGRHFAHFLSARHSKFAEGLVLSQHWASLSQATPAPRHS
jgi:hypothetical protein